MSGGAGESALREMFPWVPVVYGRIDVIIMSAGALPLLSLLKLCISLNNSRALRLHLHCISFHW